MAATVDDSICIATIASKGTACKNKAKYGAYCGLHNPNKKKKTGSTRGGATTKSNKVSECPVMKEPPIEDGVFIYIGTMECGVVYGKDNDKVCSRPIRYRLDENGQYRCGTHSRNKPKMELLEAPKDN